MAAFNQYLEKLVIRCLAASVRVATIHIHFSSFGSRSLNGQIAQIFVFSETLPILEFYSWANSEFILFQYKGVNVTFDVIAKKSSLRINLVQV